MQYENLSMYVESQVPAQAAADPQLEPSDAALLVSLVLLVCLPFWSIVTSNPVALMIFSDQ